VHALPIDSDEDRREFPPLVVVKTRVPMQREGLVRRNEIITRLADVQDRQVTVVQAPAGYGKSTVLRQWVTSDLLRRFGWLSLERTDNDPVLLWRYMLHALRVLMPEFADSAWGLVHQRQPDLQQVIGHVLNSLLDVPGRLVLVLDDYHVITNPECHESMQYFIDHLPRTMNVAFGTRTLPPLSLSKVEASGNLLAIESSALKFTLGETKQAIERTYGTVNPEVIERVQRETEGWPAAVHLSMIDNDPHSAIDVVSDGTSAISRYMTEQVIDRLSEPDHTTLAEWSILPQLNASLCDRVADRTDSAAHLEQLSEASFLLTPLDANGDWYGFHDLLRDALSREFARHPAEQQRIAHLRAMDWFLENGDTPQAIDQAMEAGDRERSAELLCANWLEYMLGGLLGTLREWIDRFPTEAMLAYPPALIASAWISAFSGDTKATHRFAAAARDASFDGRMPDGSTSYTSAVAILRAGLGHDGMKDANEHAEVAYRLEAPGGPWRQLAAALAGVTRFGLGRYEDARAALTEAARMPTPDGVAVYARGQLALLEMSAGNWEAGSRQADLACAQVEEMNLDDLVSSGAAQVAAAVAAAHVGSRGSALRRLGSLAPIQKVLSDAIPFDAFQIHLIAAETYLLLGDRHAASVHARTASSRLEAFGDAGIFEDRLIEIQKALASDGEAVDAPGSGPEPLTSRELQILASLQSDLSIRDIGSELYISRNTAKSHVASVYRKLGVTNRTAAIARARQLNLI
jgi:LuxR family maltose regulon positive regulatory protein